MPAATLDDLRRARRVLFHGVTGAGKSTAAVRLGAVLDLPVTLVDEELGWLPGWVNRTPEAQVALAEPILAGERWVLDSAYSFYREAAVARADVVVGLDYSRAATFARLLRRTVRRAATAEPVCNGNTETWGRALGPESILRWHAQTFEAKRAWIRAREADDAGTPVLRLTHPRQWERTLAALAAGR